MAKTQAEKEREAAELLAQEEELARQQEAVAAVEQPGVVEVVDVELRPSQLARGSAFSPTPSVQEDQVYGTCSMCTNLAPHESPTTVRCPRCGVQTAVLA